MKTEFGLLFFLQHKQSNVWLTVWGRGNWNVNAWAPHDLCVNVDYVLALKISLRRRCVDEIAFLVLR